MGSSFAEEGNDENPEPPGKSCISHPFWWERSDLRYDEASRVLCFGQTCLQDIFSDSDGLPTFVYRPARITKKTDVIRKALPGATLLYAIKANRHPAILEQMLRSADGIDVCSPNEARLALQSGFSERQLSYTGTSLSELDLDFLVEHPDIHVNADSLSLLTRMGKRSPGRKMGIRVNPEMGIGYRNESRLVYSGQKRPGKFGLLEEQLPDAITLARRYHIEIDTVHWHIGCGWLDGQLDDLAEILRKTTAFAAQIPGVRNINLGGGLGVPFRGDDKTLSLSRWSEIVREIVAERWHIVLEPGSFLVQDAGILLTRVNTVERKRRWTFVGVNAGFNLAMEPVFYGMRLEPVFLRLPGNGNAVEHVTIAGNINEVHDLFVEDFLMTLPEEGEAIGFLNAGAYAASMASNHCMRGEFREMIVS